MHGTEAEVELGEFWTHIGCVLVKCSMFGMHLSCSGRAFYVAFIIQRQEAFLQGNVSVFNHIGGVAGRIRCGELKAASIKVLRARNRTESDRFIAVRSPYGYDSFFCRPGKDGVHEKVECEVTLASSCAGAWPPCPMLAHCRS